MLPIHKFIVNLVLLQAYFFKSSNGHGRMLEPPARNTLWRFGFKAPPNYNDNELFCGGIGVSTKELAASLIFNLN